ncbi:MAG: polyprenyl synthetase family protein [Deltaproteobacteria bacterium]|nr:polyprenyl synthetase family protein [Candidatus Zymogenaceae bacterium]
MFNLSDYLAKRNTLIDDALTRITDEIDDASGRLKEAVRYSVFAGGKRIRPILAISATEAVGGNVDDAVTAGAAIECIHTYSLIHDDLPAMDDDDFRRGVPTSHRVFGEATAILAGDCLLTNAFSVLSDASRFSADGSRLLKVIHEIAEASGDKGMVGGQETDLESEGGEIDLPSLEFIHIRKTGALIVASVRAGAILGGGTEPQVRALTDYAKHLGLAFQITDDILDVIGTRQKMGKETGKDHVRGKATYPALLGLTQSKERAQELVDRALASLSDFGDDARPLRAIARFVIERQA